MAVLTQTEKDHIYEALRAEHLTGLFEAFVAEAEGAVSSLSPEARGRPTDRAIAILKTARPVLRGVDAPSIAGTIKELEAGFGLGSERADSLRATYDQALTQVLTQLPAADKPAQDISNFVSWLAARVDLLDARNAELVDRLTTTDAHARKAQRQARFYGIAAIIVGLLGATATLLASTG